MSSDMFKLGLGIFEFAKLRLAVSASLLPNCTVQLGPPNYKKLIESTTVQKYYKTKYIYIYQKQYTN